ncbi:MAG TPA: helix-hairpin-helix domain-containing protein, partial [Pseudogracilibacillus sp.]|nr:helix-hairpin-helix domain-containing protein [Pseudogracilibacillus sp.]
MPINKKDIVRLLEEIATYLELKGENQFRISAYRKAAQNLERDVRSLQEIEDFTTIPGIGKGTNDIIVDYIKNGESTVLQQLKEEIPAGLIPLLKLPGLGGKRLATLYKELNIVDATTLQEACESGTVEKVRGFGKKTVENITQALKTASSRPERLPIAYMLTVMEKVEAYVKNIEEIERFACAGSLRRLKESVRDIDFIIATSMPEVVREQLIQMPSVKEVIASGETKVSLTLEDEYDV